MTEKVRISIEDAEALIVAALRSNFVTPDNATSVAKALVAAEIDGQSGHGFSRVAAYALQARAGKVRGAARPEIVEVSASLARIDAGDGFAYPALDAAVEWLTRQTPVVGVAAAAIRRSHHCGQLGAQVEKLAKRGLVGVMVANAPKAIAPWGGSKPFFGTNPIAFAAPMGDAAPLVIDLSVSKVARGKVMAAAKAGEPIPEGWALDAEGRSTTDAAAALEGTMAPMGDAKGAALALMVEVLAATLTGANHSYEATSFFDAEGAPPGVGQLLLAFSPAAMLGGDVFALRMAALATAMTEEEGVRLPGARRIAAREAARREGVGVPLRLKEEIEGITASGV